MTDPAYYMHRCLQLARLGAGAVAPNPLVGAVLVHQDTIIGEGYHRQYGGPHAEVNCLENVSAADRDKIADSTLYVSLEPCAHFGKTPPCADLIIRHRIAKVVIGCRDPFVQVDGKGIEKLRAAGIEVTTGLLEAECRKLNKAFFCFHTLHRPYVILKWAQTADERMAHEDLSPVRISNAATNRIVHRWRSEVISILVGRRTALHDDPALTTRLWPGKSPLRLVVDRELKLPQHLQLFTSGHPTIIFNTRRHEMPTGNELKEKVPEKGLGFYQVGDDASIVHQIMNALYQLGITSVLVEGGSQLLQSFIDEGIWDEARVICNQELFLGAGLPAPLLKHHEPIQTSHILSDRIQYFANKAGSGSLFS